MGLGRGVGWPLRLPAAPQPQAHLLKETPLDPSGPGRVPGGAQAQLLSLEIPGEGHFLS